MLLFIKVKGLHGKAWRDRLARGAWGDRRCELVGPLNQAAEPLDQAALGQRSSRLHVVAPDSLNPLLVLQAISRKQFCALLGMQVNQLSLQFGQGIGLKRKLILQGCHANIHRHGSAAKFFSQVIWPKQNLLGCNIAQHADQHRMVGAVAFEILGCQVDQNQQRSIRIGLAVVAQLVDKSVDLPQK